MSENNVNKYIDKYNPDNIVTDKPNPMNVDWDAIADRASIAPKNVQPPSRDVSNDEWRSLGGPKQEISAQTQQKVQQEASLTTQPPVQSEHEQSYAQQSQGSVMPSYQEQVQENIAHSKKEQLTHQESLQEPVAEQEVAQHQQTMASSRVLTNVQAQQEMTRARQDQDASFSSNVVPEQSQSPLGEQRNEPSGQSVGADERMVQEESTAKQEAIRNQKKIPSARPLGKSKIIDFPSELLHEVRHHYTGRNHTDSMIALAVIALDQGFQFGEYRVPQHIKDVVNTIKKHRSFDIKPDIKMLQRTSKELTSQMLRLEFITTYMLLGDLAERPMPKTIEEMDMLEDKMFELNRRITERFSEFRSVLYDREHRNLEHFKNSK